MPTQSTGDLKATLSIPSSAKIFINGTTTDPTETFKDYYSKGQIYSVTAADGKTTANYTINATNKPIPPPQKGYWPDATAVSDSSPLPDTLPKGESLLRVINKCSYPIVIRNMGTNISVPAPGDKNNSNNALDYHIQIGIDGHKGGRVFASAGCDINNANCLIGPKNNGIGAKADTLFESVWASDKDFPIVQPDISAVNGFTFPMKMTFSYQNKPQLFDCGKLSYDFCPETFKSAFTGIIYNEKILASDGTIVACNSPMNVAAAGTEDFTRYACPNDDVKGCRDNYKMQIRPDPDPRPATADSPEYVQRLHQFGQYAGKMDASCKLYSFSYDDSFGLPSGDKDKPIVVTFCPEPGSSPKLPSH